MDAAFNQSVAVIERHIDGCEPSGPQPDERIERAEELLGFAFPPSYREFLSRYGVLSFGPHEGYGIHHDQLEAGPVPNVVWLALKDRTSGFLPPSMIEIYHDGMGFYVLDTAEGDGPPVRTWDTRFSYPDKRGEIVADSFGAFLFGLVTRHFGDAA